MQQRTLLWLSVASLAFSSHNSQASPGTEQVKACEKFILSVNLNLLPEKDSDVLDVYMLKINILYKDSEKDGTMSILDIGLPDGFIAKSEDLDALSRGVDHVVSNRGHSSSEMQGSIIIYLNKVSRVRPEEFAFRIVKHVEYGLLQPAAVSVQEYYDQKPCVRFYHPEKTLARLQQLCSSTGVRSCTCANVACSVQKKRQISHNERYAMACQTETSNKVDYVYKVRLEMTHEVVSTDIYHMRILDTLKEGTEQVQQQQLRAFIGLPRCKASLGLQANKTYLIMGVEQDVHGNADHPYQYVLGEKTWIEYWPSPEECQSDEYKPLCIGMARLEDHLNLLGCMP